MVRFTCNLHAWMQAYVGVVEHPFFDTTGADGTFRLEGLPLGTYTVEAWHERFGRLTQTVDLTDGQTAELELSFSVD